MRLTSILMLGVCLFALTAVAEETDPDGRLYAPSDDALADVEQTLALAEESGRLGLVILGANWCHDSRALAARLHREPLSNVIEENYETVFVDVGFLAKGETVLRELDVPQFYATPTVLIVDPATRQVVDNDERHRWSNAYKIDMAASVDYFERWSTRNEAPSSAPDSASLDQLFDEIDDFEHRLAKRVAAGYAVVGPMLEAYVAGDAPPEFNDRWDELASFRMAIPGAISELRNEAMRRVAAGETGIRLAFPSFGPMTWEAGSK